ncbi:MAG: bifunctional UDP-N-acetylmuramoyl-tripeptide:D-alanyl-D-alanine ligase/alanine racemase, partial [Sphingobacteriales bacterium]
VKKGINQCIIINDSYSADVNSLEIALNFLNQQAHGLKKTLILSDIRESGRSDDELYAEILQSVREHQVGRLTGIGEHISKKLLPLQTTAQIHPKIELHSSTASFLQQFMSSQFREEIILIKGARKFEFEKIVQVLEQKVHQTILEINLNAIVHNVNIYQQQLKPSVKLMAMVKAFAYGSGSAEIAGILQYHKVDYLAVAYADEGIELRKAGVNLPVMVMNTEEAAFESLVEFKTNRYALSLADLSSRSDGADRTLSRFLIV